MSVVLTVFHVIACFTLVGVILLQAGRGGGLSDMFGGGMQQQQKLFGSQTNAFMAKVTTGCAVVFIITSISLGVITSQKSRSLVTPDAIKPVFPTPVETNIQPGNQTTQADVEAKASEAQGKFEEDAGKLNTP